MKHWSASKQDEYCLIGKTESPFSSSEARNCPKSDVSSAPADTADEVISTHPKLPDASCVLECIPIVSFDANRKTQARGEPHEGGYKLQEAVWDGRYDTKLVRLQAESPMDQIRRKIPLGRWMRAVLHTFGLVFFRLAPWLVAFFPRFGASQSDLLLVKNTAKFLDTDRLDDFILNNILAKLFKGPAFERLAQQIRRAESRFCNNCTLLFGAFFRPAGLRFWLNSSKAGFVKFLDDISDMLIGKMQHSGDGGNFEALRTLIRFLFLRR